MKTETFLLRATCSILMLIILLLDYNQYERIKQCEKDITTIQETLYLNWQIERLEKKLKPLPPLEFPIPLLEKLNDKYAQQF